MSTSSLIASAELSDRSSIVPTRKLVLPPELIAARHQHETDGFAIMSGKAVRRALEPIDLSGIVEAVRTAPVDPYDRSALRQKLYSQVHRHHDGTLSAVPAFQDGPNLAVYTTYFQASHFNQQFGNLNRRFPPFRKELLESVALQKLVNLCFAIIPLWRLKSDGRNPLLVGLHGQRLTSDGRRAAVSTPPQLHQDGEPQTFVVMLERENALGGVSYVATADAAGKSPEDVDPSQILARGTLAEPLDILAVDDERVAHHVSGVLGANGRPGSRSVLLIDFSEIELVRTPPTANE